MVYAYGTTAQQNLAKLLLLRDIAIDKQVSAESRFGANFREAINLARGATLESSTRQTVDQIFGEETDVLTEFDLVVAEILPAVKNGIESQKATLRAARQVWVLEGMIAAEVFHQIDLNHQLEVVEIGSQFRCIPTGYKSGDEAFAAINISNKSGEEIKWCVIVLSVPCDYQMASGDKLNTQVGEQLFEMISGANSPDYSGRDKAFEEYSAVDKTAIFYVQDWQPNQVVQVISTAAPEFYNTATGARVTLIGSDFKCHEQLNIDSFKRLLLKRFAHPSARRANRR